MVRKEHRVPKELLLRELRVRKAPKAHLLKVLKEHRDWVLKELKVAMGPRVRKAPKVLMALKELKGLEPRAHREHKAPKD